MPVLTVEGTYRDGKVELAETPADVREAHILVTFLPAELATGAGAFSADEEAQREKRRLAAERLLEHMRAGIDFGGERFDREAIYEERMAELDERRSRHQ